MRQTLISWLAGGPSNTKHSGFHSKLQIRVGVREDVGKVGIIKRDIINSSQLTCSFQFVFLNRTVLSGFSFSGLGSAQRRPGRDVVCFFMSVAIEPGFILLETVCNRKSRENPAHDPEMIFPRARFH